MKTIKFIGPWSTFFTIVGVVSLVFFFFLPFGFAVLLFLLSFISISVPVLIKAWYFVDNCDIGDKDGESLVSISKNYALMLSYNGKYTGHPLFEGQYVIFPLFGLYKVEDIIYTGNSQVSAFDDDSDNFIDFACGASEKIIALINLKISKGSKSIEKYTFERDADKLIKSEVVKRLREYLGGKNLVDVHKGNIALDDLKTASEAKPFEEITKKYGVEITSINIEDIELSEETKTANKEKYLAKVAVEAAKSKKEEMKIEAEAKAEVLKINAKAKAEATKIKAGALSKQVALLQKDGASPEIVLAYLAETKKWSSMKPSDKAVIIDNGKSVAGMLSALKNLNL